MSFKASKARQRKVNIFKDVVHKTRSRIRMRIMTGNPFFKSYGSSSILINDYAGWCSPYHYFFTEMWDNGISHNFNEGLEIAHPFREHIINKKRSKRRHV